MGVFALVEYSLINEICDKVKRNRRRFRGRLKPDSDHERPAGKKQKIDKMERFLLSDEKSKGERSKKVVETKTPSKGKLGLTESESDLESSDSLSESLSADSSEYSSDSSEFSDGRNQRDIK